MMTRLNKCNKFFLQAALVGLAFFVGLSHAETIKKQKTNEHNTSKQTFKKPDSEKSNAKKENIIGHIELVGKQASKAKLGDVIVYFEPENRVQPEPLSSPYPIKMKNKSYQPRVSAIPLGSDIQISNHDSILHNAFSPSRSNKFDLGLYGKSEGKFHRFNSAGVVRIFCNVHYHMVAYVLVLDTPYYTKVDSNGDFSLSGLPSGKGKLSVWHERANKVLKNIELPYSEPLVIEVAITKRRIPQHTSKTGKSYKKKRRRRKY